MSKANVVDKVAIDDLSEATVHGICNDPALKPGDKVQYLEKFISRAVKARMSYDTGYGSLVHKESLTPGTSRHLSRQQRLCLLQVHKV